MAKIDLPGALDVIRGAESFLVTSHTSPDGDAAGSVLGMRFLLEALGKRDVVCALQDPVPGTYSWMPGMDGIVDTEGARGRDYDVLVILDVAQLARIGSIAELARPEQTILVLDHHLEPNPCGTHNFIAPSYSSASEIVADLFAEADIPYTRDAATCIYVGLTTDTGGFRYANTNADSHRRAASLVAAGIDVSWISSAVFDVMRRPKKELLQRMLERIQYGAEGALAFSYLTLADLDETEALPEDVDGLVNFARNIEGVLVGILFREHTRGRVKISMRSTGVMNSATLLREFGGGGHAGAAGATVDGALDTVMSDVVARVEETLAETETVARHG